jgi:hypothetical protein
VTWTYEAPPDQCRSGAVGNGAQEVSYFTRKIKVTAVRSKLGDNQGLIQLARTDDPVAQYGIHKASRRSPGSRRRRDHEWRRLRRHGWQHPAAAVQGLRHPLLADHAPGWLAQRGRVSVGSKYDTFTEPAAGGTDDLVHPSSPPANGEGLGQVYSDCPLLLPRGSAPAFDQLTEASQRINESRLPKKGKTLKISGGDQHEAADADGKRTSQTSVS